jgi:hypothetical protein
MVSTGFGENIRVQPVYEWGKIVHHCHIQMSRRLLVCWESSDLAPKVVSHLRLLLICLHGREN